MQEAASLRVALTGFDIEIEHVGSTAVEGMSAKPIVDLMVGLRRPDDLERIVEAASRGGWEDLGEAGVAGRRYLRRRGSPDLNLHLVALDSGHWRHALALRDYLRTHPEERTAYSNAKTSAVAAGHTWLLAYSDAKAGYLAALVERALAWGASKPSGQASHSCS